MVSHLRLQQRDRAQNLFNQTDLDPRAQTGRFGHTLLAGFELGRQDTDNFRNTGFFTSSARTSRRSTRRSSAPTISLPLEFRQGATDADNHGVANVAAVYVQDQIALSSQVQAIVGLRFDSFDADFTNNRTATDSQPRRRCLAALRPDLQAARAAVALRQLHALLPAAGRRAALLAVADQPGARPRGVQQLRARREMGRRPASGHGRGLPPRPQQRRRARSR